MVFRRLRQRKCKINEISADDEAKQKVIKLAIEAAADDLNVSKTANNGRLPYGMMKKTIRGLQLGLKVKISRKKIMWLMQQREGKSMSVPGMVSLTAMSNISPLDMDGVEHTVENTVEHTVEHTLDHANKRKSGRY